MEQEVKIEVDVAQEMSLPMPCTALPEMVKSTADQGPDITDVVVKVEPGLDKAADDSESGRSAHTYAPLLSFLKIKRKKNHSSVGPKLSTDAFGEGSAGPESTDTSRAEHVAPVSVVRPRLPIQRRKRCSARQQPACGEILKPPKRRRKLCEMKNPGRGIRHGSSKNSVTANEELMLQMEKQKRYQYVCIECGMMYTSSGHLKTHMYKHTGEKPFPCTFPGCSAAFYESGNLKTHMRTHTKEKPFGCMYCGTRFARSTDLRIHVRSHTGERPYACKHPDCTAAFTECGKLKRHMLIHSGERPHACLLCNAGFTDAGHLRRHVMRHTGEKPHACSYCNKTFAQAGELRRHTRSRHCETPKRRGRPPKPKPTQDGAEAEPAPQQSCEVSQASSEPEIETEGESMSLKRFDDGRAETFQTGDSNSSSSTYSVGKMDAVKKAFYGHTARLPSESPEVEQRTAVKLEIDADASVQPVGDSTTLPGAEVTSASVASQQADCVVKLEPSSDSEETDNMDVYFQPNLGKSQKAKPVNQKAQVKVQNNQALHPEELQNCANAAFEAGWSNQFAEQGDCVDAAELDLLHKQFVERFVNKRPPGRRILSCGECSAKFATPSKLKRHVMIHQGERPFKCPHCIHAFTQAGNLKVHLRKHNGERPFVCEVCANAFTRSAELKRHLRIYHSS